MAGEYIVDVAAAAQQAKTGKSAAQAPVTLQGIGTVECPLGHAQPSNLKFCGDCGLPLAQLSLGPRVDLQAIRDAVKPADMLDAQERSARDQAHVDALGLNATIEQRLPTLEQVADPSEKKITIHFVEDGFTWHKVWHRGEELVIGPEHPWWEGALAWIRLTKQEQYARYGRVFFDFGPWPGPRPGQGREMALATAATSRWASIREGAVPATPSNEDGIPALKPW